MNAEYILFKLLGLLLVVIGFLITRYNRLKEFKLPVLSDMFEPTESLRKINERIWNKTLFSKVISYNSVMAIGGVLLIVIGVAILLNKIK